MKTTLLLTSLLLTSCILHAQSYALKIPAGKKVKTITGRGYSEDRGDTMTVFIQSYDEKGNLLGHSEPLMYCGETNTYDSQNRLTVRELMCGESSGNGTYNYTYTGNTCTETFSGAIWESKTTTTYVNGRIAEEVYEQNSLDNNMPFKTVSTARYNYIFNVNGLLKEEQVVETSIYEDLGGSAAFIDTTTREKITEYSYTAFDSLEKMVKKETAGSIETTQFSYDEKTHQKIGVLYDRVNPATPNNTDYRDSYRHDEYIYDQKGNLTKHLQFGYNQDHAEHKNDPKVPDLIEEYEDGLLFRSTVTQYKNERVTFTYEFWD
jgi:hypothetical protein